MKRNGLLALSYHALFVAFILAPLVVVMLVSFTDRGYISMPAHGASLRWFRALWEERDLRDAFGRSLMLGFASATGATVLAVAAGWALVRHQVPGKSAITEFLLSPLMIPHVVLGVAFLQFYSRIGASGSFIWLCLAHIVVILPYALRMVIAAAVGLGRDANNAALSLGASPSTAFRRVSLPQLTAGVAGGWLLAFIQSFDELSMTIFVASPGTPTLPVAMYTQVSQSIDPMVAALSTVLIAGTVALMLAIDRVIGLDTVLVGKG